MSNEDMKTGSGSGDQPILLGQPNDPKLIGKVDLFTGPALDSAIAKLDAFVGGAFTESSDDEPFPFGIGSDEPEGGSSEDQVLKIEETAETPVSVPDEDRSRSDVITEDLEAADGLDRILDRLDEEDGPAEETPANRPLSLLDIEKRFETGQSVLSAPVSPIAEILARTSDHPTDPDAEIYDDPGIAADLYGAEQAEADPEQVDEKRYDPLADLQDFDLPEPEEEAIDESEPLPEEEDPFDAFDLIRDMGEPEPDDKGDTSETGQSYGLPEPTPFADTSGLSGFFTEEDPETSLGETPDFGPEPEPDTTISDPEPETDPIERNDTPPAPVRRATPTQGDESVLDSLFADLRWGGPAPSSSQGDEVDPAEDGDLMAEKSRPTVVSEAEGDAQVSPDEGVSDHQRGFIPSFMRPGGGPRPSIFPKLSATAPEPEPAEDTVSGAADMKNGDTPFRTAEPETELPADQIPQGVETDPSWNDEWRGDDERGDNLMSDTQEVTLVTDEAPRGGVDDIDEVSEQENHAPAGKRRKRLLMGVAAVALLGAGLGGFLLMSGPEQTASGSGTTIVVRTPIGTEVAPPPVSAFEPQTTELVETGAGAADEPLLPSFEVAADPEGEGLMALPFMGAQEDLSPSTLSSGSEVETADQAGGNAGSEAPEPFMAGDTTPSEPALAPGSQPELTPLPVEIADLMREIQRPETSEMTATPDQVLALEGRLAEMDARLAAANDRSDALSSELTGLIDQITGALQRNSEQAERIDRMERMIRSQSAILGQIGQMEESLEQTQIVLLDVSARIGRVEGQNPADRDAVNRALSDLESRLQALTANMSILARMSIEGVDALRVPGASSGTVGVRSSPERVETSGGSNTVFQTQQGGFRISSDAAGRVPANVKKDDFIEGYGYVLDVLPASDGQRLIVMENGSVLIPGAD